MVHDDAALEPLFGSDENAAHALIRLVIGVTGHRDLLPEQRAATEDAVCKQLLSLAERFPSTPLRLISPLAEGADRLVAQTFLRLRDERLGAGNKVAAAWDIIVPLPLPEAEYAKDFAQSLEEFERLKNAASVVFELPQRAGHTAAERSEYGPARDLQYLDAGLYVGRHCHVLIGLWDGETTDLTGGTAQVINLKLGKLADRHFSEAAHHHDHDCGPVIHIKVGRARKSGEPKAAGDTPDVTTTNIDPSDAAWSLSALQRAFIEIDALNHQISSVGREKRAEHLRNQWGYLTGEYRDRAGSLMSSVEVQMVSCLCAIDNLAVDLDTRRNSFIRALYILGAATAVFLWTGIDGLGRNWMIAGYLASFAAIGIVLRRLQSKGHSLNRFLYRIAAEAMRVQTYWSLAQLTRTTGPERTSLPPRRDYPIRVLDSFLGQQMHELAWVREILRGIILPPIKHPVNEESLRQKLADFWVEGQKTYFAHKGAQYDRRVQQGTLVSRILYGAGVTFAAAYVMENGRLQLPHLLDHGLAIAAAVAPALAFLLQGYLDKMGYEEIAKSYERMELIFERAQRKLHEAGVHFGRRSTILKALGTEAITETTNWLILKKARVPTVPG